MQLFCTPVSGCVCSLNVQMVNVLQRIFEENVLKILDNFIHTKVKSDLAKTVTNPRNRTTPGVSKVAKEREKRTVSPCLPLGNALANFLVTVKSWLFSEFQQRTVGSALP